MAEDKKIRVFIADDSATVRDRLAALLGEMANVEVVGQAHDAADRFGAFLGVEAGDALGCRADELLTGLDPQGVRWLRDFLRGFAADGNAVLVSSHLLAEMAQLADEVVVIDRGRLVRHAPLRELTKGSRSLEEAFFELTEERER